MRSAINNTTNQGIGAYVEYINSVRADELQMVLSEISNKLNEEYMIDGNSIIANINADKISKIINDFDSEIDSLEETVKVNYNEDQKNAIRTALENSITIISGNITKKLLESIKYILVIRLVSSFIPIINNI